jgi:hypothetical protein
MRRRTLPPALLAMMLPGCGTVKHSVFPTTETSFPSHEGRVQVSFTREPEGGTPLAIVQVYRFKAGAIESLIPEMTRVAAGLGADFVKVDRVKTHFDRHDETKTTTYDCGTTEEPKTCSDTTTETVHDSTTQLIGRAFRTMR